MWWKMVRWPLLCLLGGVPREWYLNGLDEVRRLDEMLEQERSNRRA